MLMYEREIVCQNCGKLFKDFDSEAPLCRKCWNFYWNNQLKPTVEIRLTKEYVDNFLENYQGDKTLKSKKVDFTDFI